MALIHCPDCEREVSSRAVACPQCAYPIHALTSLPDAIRQNDIDMIRDLLKAGRKPDEKNGDGVHPLLLACQQGSLSITKLLVEAGADLNHQDQDGRTALMEAAMQENNSIAKFLLDQGADPAIQDQNGDTAYDVALNEENSDLIELLKPVNEDDEDENDAEEDLPTEFMTQPDDDEEDAEDEEDEQEERIYPPPIPSLQAIHESDFEAEGARFEPPRLDVVEPPPLPPNPMRFVDDLAPVQEDEKYEGPGLICRTCRAQIAAEDIWCSHCKAPIIRRYCGGCVQLIPDNAARCPYCQSSKVHRFRYMRHLEQIVAGAAILAVLIFVLGIYSPTDSSSYAKKLAEKRSEQQEQKAIVAEETSKKLREQRQAGGTTNRAAVKPASVRVIPRDMNQVVEAQGTSESGSRIPTVERIEVAPAPEEEPPKPAPDRTEVIEKTETDEQETDEQKEEVTEKPVEREEGSVTIAERLNDQGFRLMKNGRYSEAIPVLAQAVRSFPSGKRNVSYGYALYNLGRSLRMIGRPDLAIPILEERLKIPDQRETVARELEQARAELNGPEQFDNIQFE